MNRRIETLTDEHRASFDEWTHRWINIGRSTDETDYPNAIQAVHMAWTAANLQPPYVLFTRSPIEALSAWTELTTNPDTAHQFIAPRGDNAGIWHPASPRHQPPTNWHENMLYGAHDAGWLSYYDWFAHHGLADIVQPLQGLILLAKSAGWTIACEHMAIVSDRPVELHDELTGNTPYERRLHNADGPSVAYCDGWQLHHWHGVLVPEWVINDPTVDRIQAESNTEIRRCAIESFGWENYLPAIDAVLVDSADDPGNPGRTLELFDVPAVHQPYDEPTRILVMENASRDRDGSRRRFAETVPAGLRSAVAAAAWQFDVDVDVYSGLERAT